MSKHPPKIIFLILAAMAIGCNYKTFVASRDFSGDASTLPTQQPIDSVYLLGAGENRPDSSTLLADITVYSPLIWMESYDSDHSAFTLMLDRARKEARDMGGNAIQIVDCSAKKFARCKLLARVYSLKPAPVASPVSPDSCIVHIKINATAARTKPVPINKNDSLIGISDGIDLSGRWHIDHDAVGLPRIEQFTLESAGGGWLYTRTDGVRNPYRVRLQKGREYYVLVHYTSQVAWTKYYFSLVTKEAFELNRFLY